MTLGAMLRDRRNALGFTQEIWAAKMGIGVRTLRGWESDSHVPETTHIRMLSRVLNVGVAKVLDAIEAAQMMKAEVMADASHLPSRGDL